MTCPRKMRILSKSLRMNSKESMTNSKPLSRTKLTKLTRDPRPMLDMWTTFVRSTKNYLNVSKSMFKMILTNIQNPLKKSGKAIDDLEENLSKLLQDVDD